MIKNVLKGYKLFFFSIIKILLLVVFCTVAALAAVWPLWYFASKAPHIYTLCTLALALIFICVLIIRSIKKSSAKSVLFTLIQVLLVFAGLFFFVYFVFKGQRILSLFSSVVFFISFGIVKFGLHQK